MGTAINEELERRIGLALKAGMPHRTAAREFGVSRNTIARVASGRPRRRRPRAAAAPPFRVPRFDCPQCGASSMLKWDKAAQVCFACSVRARQPRQSRVQS